MVNAGLEGMETANNHYIMLFLIFECFEATVSIHSSPELHSKVYKGHTNYFLRIVLGIFL